MVHVFIDHEAIEVPDGTTVLAAARQLGIDIPALCYYEGFPPNTSCGCCLVRVDDSPSPVPACATTVRDGMRVESESDGVHELRRTALELLLGDHAGDCHAPCENTCPARMDIPDMLRHVAAGDYRAAIATVKREIALPAILGRICPEVCENTCRRGQHDSPAAICKLKQFVADRDLQSPQPYRPPIAPTNGKHVAIVGSGPSGLTAAYHLAQRGYHCTLIEKHQELGGRLHSEFPEQELPRDVLQAEIDTVLQLGVQTRTACELGQDVTLDKLVHEFDAVLLAIGRCESQRLGEWRLATTSSGVRVDTSTRQTSQDRVFAAGNVVRPYQLVVQSVAAGKLAAQCIDSWFRDVPPPDRRRAFETRLARLTSGELCNFCEGYPETPRVEVDQLADGLSDELARREAERCLQCGCGAVDTCQLRHYAQIYQCDAHRFRGQGRRYEGRLTGDRVALEHGKCIACGICVQITTAAADAVGLTQLGRSIQMRIGPPQGVTLDEALGSVARQCAEACPTGAIIALTAHAMSGEREKSIDKRCDD